MPDRRGPSRAAYHSDRIAAKRLGSAPNRRDSRQRPPGHQTVLARSACRQGARGARRLTGWSESLSAHDAFFFGTFLPFLRALDRLMRSLVRGSSYLAAFAAASALGRAALNAAHLALDVAACPREYLRRRLPCGSPLTDCCRAVPWVAALPPTFKKTSKSHDRSARNPLCRKRKGQNRVPPWTECSAYGPNYVVRKYKTRASDEIILSIPPCKVVVIEPRLRNRRPGYTLCAWRGERDFNLCTSSVGGGSSDQAR
jgi:hypothetical protein